jgi:hypothetical protein
MGALFRSPKTPAPPPPPPNPQVSANASSSLTGSQSSMKDMAGGTVLTSPTGAPEIKPGGKSLLGQ